MKAVLMAGGFGKRLHPLTSNIPKPLVPICMNPVMEYVVALLKKHGITDLVVLLHHQPHLIKEYFGDGSSFGVKIEYVFAGEDYGTAGAVKFAQEHLKETFMVISADLLTDIDLTAAVGFHKQKKSKSTIVLTSVPDPLEYGIVITGDDGRIKYFLEKPSWEEVFSDNINTGIYILEPDVLSYIPEKKQFDFSKDLFPRLLSEKTPFFGFVSGGYWKDIGNLVEYMRAHKDAVEKDLLLCKNGVSPGAKVSSSARLDGNVIIGDGAFIGDGAVVVDSVIGAGCSVGRGAKISKSIVWDSVEIGKECSLHACIVAGGAIFGERVKIEEGCVIGQGCVLGSDSTVKSYIKLWPGKTVEEGSIVNSSMIWKQRWAKSIFGQYGVTGTCNVDLTPEFAAKLGSAFGAMLGKGAAVTSSMDGHKASRMISRGLISGLLSAGVNVSNLETVPAPINRFELKAMRSKGGIHVRRSPFDRNIIDIKFFGSDGTDLSSSKEKEIEKLFWGEDYERPTIDETGDLSFPFYRVAEGYKEAVLNFVDDAAIKKRQFKIVIDYSFGSASQIFPSILGDLDCETVALNAYIDENKFTKSREDFERSLKQLSQIVVTLKADIGIMFDAGAEKIFIVDEKGRVLDGYMSLLLFVSLVSSYGTKKDISVPVTASSVVEAIAAKNNISVVRSRASLHSIMETASRSGVQFVGEDSGGYIFPEFHPSFDAMLSSVKLLGLLANCGCPVSSVVESIPRRNMAKDSVPCPNSLKGTIIRQFFEDNRDGRATLLDGVKIELGKDWVLINGHPDRQEIMIYAESDSPRTAKDLALKYFEKIKGVVASHLKK
jgi:mannose-1-phosphate guanylyltransferase / phosphomannomutase